ncbi:hypothetical protein SAMD00019534_085160 [Acytostelium subglobosum LB1]|uniref:hypothetical protein n=1 Tax=Acytostelium subglobosum LB1 TaxID=1410327 RepID=UPI000644A5AF|nr:hypothetical protein SAMD00019534_085160 [Acytostelium subglobosum LB1]GAM25341.1 hypothetical protein SAMD00019534_085160 [Acytostelium subglobosum LB1]|eukprot:XP_012751861.1 hypothetical protein SAMD00019534_085160 [Acytostelium subglobosum LB1]
MSYSSTPPSNILAGWPGDSRPAPVAPNAPTTLFDETHAQTSHTHIDASRNKIWIVLNQTSYVGGDTVSGTVELDCHIPFNAKGVLAKFKGFERVWLQEHRLETEGEGNDKRTVQKLIDHRENKEFFRSSICVYPQQGIVNPGHYSFPFQYQLPPTLPGTFSEEGKDATGNYQGTIMYKVKATVDVAHKHDLKATSRLVVNERCNDLVKPNYAENRKSFLLTKGKLVAQVWMNKNVYYPGETLVNKVKINNTSIKETRRISIKVSQRIELRAHLYYRTLNKQVYKQEYDGVPPCFYGKRYLPFSIPVHIKPSSSIGEHIRSVYQVEVEFDIPGALDLVVTLPLTVFAPQFLYSTLPPQPPSAPLPPDVSYRHPWEDDEQVKNCNQCKEKFSLFVRKHHCRHCMKVFCSKCCARESTILNLGFSHPVKVCEECFPKALIGGAKFESAKQFEQSYQEALAQYNSKYPWLEQQHKGGQLSTKDVTVSSSNGHGNGSYHY